MAGRSSVVPSMHNPRTRQLQGTVGRILDVSQTPLLGVSQRLRCKGMSQKGMNRRTQAYSQRIVTARPLYRLQHPVRTKSSASDSQSEKRLIGSGGPGRPPMLAHGTGDDARPDNGRGSPRANLAAPPPSDHESVVASSVDEDLRGVQS